MRCERCDKETEELIEVEIIEYNNRATNRMFLQVCRACAEEILSP